MPEIRSNFYLNLPWKTRAQLGFRRMKAGSLAENADEEDALLFMKYRDGCVTKPDGNGVLRIQKAVGHLMAEYDNTVQFCRIADAEARAGFEGRSAGPRLAIEEIIYGSNLLLKEDPILYFVFQSASASDFNLKQIELVMCYSSTFDSFSRSYVLTTFPTDVREAE